jgi:hypothetical protein
MDSHKRRSTVFALPSFIFLSTLFVVSATGGSARAAPSTEGPETLIREGVALRRQGQDSRAEGYFQRAYELAPTPRTAAQLGLVELALGKFLAAATHIGEALRSNDAWVTEHRKVLEDGVAAASKHLLRVELTGAPHGATFALNGADDTSTLAPDGVIWLAPGPATSIRLEKTGRKPALVRAEGAAGETRRIPVDMPSLDAPPTAPPPVAQTTPSPPAPAPVDVAATPPAPRAEPASPSRPLRIAGIVVGSVGAVTAVVGGVLLAQGLSKRDDINTAAKNMKPYDTKDGNWETLRDVGIGCAVAGGVALVAGAGLFAYDLREGAASPGVGSAVSFVPRAGFGVLSYQGSF